MADVRGGASELDVWLAPFPDVLGRKTRRTWAPLYLHGLLGPGERKSLRPTAARLGLSGHDRLQHFISSPAWDDGPLWRVLAERADHPVGGPEAALVIDDTALPKKGVLSVGVARQYRSRSGKRANCQAPVSPTLARDDLARDEVPVPVGPRLFLPDECTADPERRARAGVPEAEATSRSKGEIALAEPDRLRAVGVRFGVVLADAGYGASVEFRRGLDERGLRWAVGIARNQKLYGQDVRLVPPAGRKRRPVPDREPRAAEEILAGPRWRPVAWRRGTKGALAARVRVADCATFGNDKHLPGEEAWLVGEWRPSGGRKCHLGNLPPDTPLRALVAAIEARWVCEQAHQWLEQELGLGHFEGRSWTGLHRHAPMACIAFADLQHLRLAEHRRTGPGKNAPPCSGAATVARPARRAPRHHGPAVRARRHAAPMPAPSAPIPADP